LKGIRIELGMRIGEEIKNKSRLILITLLLRPPSKKKKRENPGKSGDGLSGATVEAVLKPLFLPHNTGLK
jgi:hypothetical protein